MIKMFMRKNGNSLTFCDFFEAAIPLSIFDEEGVRGENRTRICMIYKMGGKIGTIFSTVYTKEIF